MEMENEKYMYLPTLTEDEFVENVESENFFRRFWQPCHDPDKSRGKLHRAERRIVRSHGRTVWLSRYRGADPE